MMPGTYSHNLWEFLHQQIFAGPSSMRRTETQEDLGASLKCFKCSMGKGSWLQSEDPCVIYQGPGSAPMLPACVIINKADPLWALCNERTVAESLGPCEDHIDWWASSEAHVSHLLRSMRRYLPVSLTCQPHLNSPVHF